MEPIVVTLTGPTAAGKTAVACALADLIPCALISMDSAMVYRGMDIGTAKPTADERKRYPHALIDIRDPAQSYSAADFVADADREIDAALRKGLLPVVVGGTMLYARAFREGLANLPSADAGIRSVIERDARERGWAALHAELTQVDPRAARLIHPNNPQRLQRALEVYRATGKPLSEWWDEQTPADTRVRLGVRLREFAVTVSERHILHERIAERFRRMLAAGFEAEVSALLKREDLGPELPSMRAVGYRQMWSYLNGEVGAEQMCESTIAATRQLAKKQLTWLRAWPHVRVLEGDAGALARQIARTAVEDWVHGG